MASRKSRRGGVARTAKRRRKPKPRKYPPVTSTRLIGFFRRLKTLPSMAQMERLLVEEALYRTAWNKSHAAILLGITREGLRKKLARIYP
jgi:DNA-binding NtrC family response regulator